MENKELLTLFKNGEYGKVIDQTASSKDEDVLFLRAISFALSSQYENAIKTLTDNENILKDNMPKLIDVHMEICFWASKFDDAKNALNHYEEYPYISQEVEEKFRFYKKEIDKKIAGNNKRFYSEEDLIKFLNSENVEEVQLAFSELKKYEIEPYIDDVKRVISSQIDMSTRCLGLILLYEKKYSHPVIYNWHGEQITVIPSQLKTPFQDQKFKKLLEMKEESKDVAYSQTFETLLATYYLYMYPRAVDNDIQDLFAATDLVTRKYIGWPQNKMRQKPKVEALMSIIEEANRVF